MMFSPALDQLALKELCLANKDKVVVSTALVASTCWNISELPTSPQPLPNRLNFWVELIGACNSIVGTQDGIESGTKVFEIGWFGQVQQS